MPGPPDNPDPTPHLDPTLDPPTDDPERTPDLPTTLNDDPVQSLVAITVTIGVGFAYDFASNKTWKNKHSSSVGRTLVE